ncbi:MAG: hypothetical protein PVF43_01635 [Candidatus Eiseniibacteriota bacterium]
MVCLAITATGIGLAAGCSVDSGPAGPNRPPETLLTFAGPVDTVNSHVRLRWWGSDPDGTVTGYEYRWAFDGGTPADWTFTAALTDSFALPAPSGAASHRFEVRAIDDAGEADPTPAAQTYHVYNRPPTIRFRSVSSLPAVSLPAVTVEFVAEDPDGDDTVREVVAWLDGQDPETEGNRVPYPAVFVTYGPEDFATYGERTLFLQAIDDGGAKSNAIQHTLDVVEPVGTVLLLDDMPDDIAGGTTQTDPFYREAMDEVMAGAPYTLHKIEEAPFRTRDEAAAIFGLFDVVVWYQGTNTVDEFENPIPVSTFSLANATDAIRALLARGGRMLLVTMNAVGDQGAFSDDFARETLGLDSWLLNEESAEPETDTNFFLQTRYYTGQPRWLIEGRGAGLYEDLGVIGFYWGVELAAAAPGVEVLYEIPADIVYEGQPRAVIATRIAGPGAMIYLGFPLSRCSFEQRHRAVIRSILRDELALP